MIARVSAAAAAAVLFGLLATANSGGYRYGVSDQAFYIPALARALDPALFPRDAALLAPQMRAWLGDDVVAAVARVIPIGPIDLPALAGVLYVAGLIGMGAAVAYFLRGLGASWWATGAGLAIASLRHRIPRTGANSLEGYFHPRMLAFALGLWALGLILRRRPGAALLVILVAAVVHPTTAVWMGGAVVLAAVSERLRRLVWLVVAVAAAATAWIALTGDRMSPDWIAVVADKDYLFPASWPAWAWAINLAYPVVLWLVYRRRVALAAAVRGERALVTALLLMMGAFLLSVPLAEAHVALAVQLQVTRILWVLDAVTLCYVAWWLVDDLAAGAGMRWRAAQVVLLMVVAAARGTYILKVDTPRPLVTRTLPADDWTEAMRFLRDEQPKTIHVLADPGHAWMYGSSVRVAALRDTVLESVKDTAMAIYDRDVARRVGERLTALARFPDLSDDELRAVAARYQADVLVVDRARAHAFPVLHENRGFVVYDIR